MNNIITEIEGYKGFFEIKELKPMYQFIQTETMILKIDCNTGKLVETRKYEEIRK